DAALRGMAAKGKTLLAVADGRRAGLEALTGREVAISDAAAMRRIVLPDVPGKLAAGGRAAIPGKPVEAIRVDADMVVAPVEITPEEPRRSDQRDASAEDDASAQRRTVV